jgi:hypothetical protein
VTLADRDTFSDVIARTGLDLAIQRPLEPHEFFDDLSPSAAATLRLTTAREPDGTARARGAYLRLGRTSDQVVSSWSQVRVPVDLETGRLHDTAALPDWSRTDRHPDTGAAFEGGSVPHFTEGVRLVEALHAKMPHIAYAGWDVCITQSEGAKLFEVNVRQPAVAFSEAAVGPLFAGLGWDRLHLHQ